MKRLIILLAMAIAVSAMTFAQESRVTEESVTQTEIPYKDQAEDGSVTISKEVKEKRSSTKVSDLLPGDDMQETLITLTAIVLSLGMPIIIVFLSLYFNYKNKRAKYKLVEQALASGQPIPESLFQEGKESDTRSKGIKNIFLGLGLFIFLWAITDSFSIGTIGLLVLFTGFGQLFVALSKEKDAKKAEKHDSMTNWREIDKSDITDDFSK